MRECTARSAGAPLVGVAQEKGDRHARHRGVTGLRTVSLPGDRFAFRDRWPQKLGLEKVGAIYPGGTRVTNLRMSAVHPL